MLALFPDILFLAPFSALVIRVSVALILAIAAWRHVSAHETTVRGFAIIEVAAAAVLIAGAWVQAAALAALLVLVFWLVVPRVRVFPLSAVLLAIVMCLSLLVTGAGAFAFDLPL